MFEDNELEKTQTSGDGEYHGRPEHPIEEIPRVTPTEPADQPQQFNWAFSEPSNRSWQESPSQNSWQANQYIPDVERAKKKEKKKGKSAWLKVTALALCFSLIGGALGSGVAVFLMRQPGGAPSPEGNVTVLQGDRENITINKENVNTGKLMTPAEVYAANVACTVGITTSITTNFWGYQTTSAASGSGFIYSKEGYILTNHHVIEGSSSITVSFYDGSSAEAKLIGYDQSNDIAVLKVNAENLTPVILGNSGNMNVGDTVLAIGNPLGELTFTLTSGIVSALDRQVTTSAGVTMTLMQTDCAINSGNSGGALFNLYGEVVGITNAKYSSSSSSEASIDNIGFAIPINKIRTIVDSIITKGYYSKPYIGVSVIDVSEETQSYGLPKGAAVKEVVKDSPAEKAGLHINDIITQVDGKEITSSSDLVAIIGNSSVGQTLNLTVYRMGAYIDIKLTVGEQKQNTTQQQQQQQQQPSFKPFG